MAHISYIVPLGLRCTTAEAFKKRSLRLFALPFDWLFLSTEVILSCLQDNFSALLDQKLMRKIGVSGTHPKIFHSKYTPMVPNSDCTFVHHDPSQDTGYAYFARTVDRFNFIMSAREERKLFTLCCIDPLLWNEDGVRSIFSTLKTLTTNFIFIAVNLESRAGASSSSLLFHEKSADGGAELIMYNQLMLGTNTGQQFSNRTDQDYLTTLLMFPPRTDSSIRNPYKFRLKSIN
ncbi:hypothetical protein TrST_g10892 [Triparma strigata]|uniref:Uncharacterized protein n=1 Tax=Triparma strigata TaxID=1606541 RepID=A0A9W7DUG8_9STRA|nr:hypothetical protein TrST_g10892 [Triparma strigata]